MNYIISICNVLQDDVATQLSSLLTLLTSYLFCADVIETVQALLYLVLLTTFTLSQNNDPNIVINGVIF